MCHGCHDEGGGDDKYQRTDSDPDTRMPAATRWRTGRAANAPRAIGCCDFLSYMTTSCGACRLSRAVGVQRALDSAVGHQPHERDGHIES